MIDAKELRIGNWVRQLGKPCQIDLGVLFHLAQGGHAVEGFDPIPLTPELLEKAGFKIVVGQAFTAMASKEGIDLFFLYPAIGETLEVVFAFNNLQGETTRRELKYVHELQNLLMALNGQELEITL